MKKFAIAVHGGAGPDSDLIKNNKSQFKQGLKDAINAGYKVLENGGSAVDAVEAAVNVMEDYPLFNAGRGGAMNCNGEIEMDASIMSGKDMKAGAVSQSHNIKNPVSVARYISEQTNHVLISGDAVTDLAKNAGVEIQPEDYFFTKHQHDEYKKAKSEESTSDQLLKRVHGTVGAVALDIYGNLAAATSTGGTTNSLPGRVGDSCIIGAGCYANNNTCAVSGTGDGEYLITGVIAHAISAQKEFTGCSLQEACDEVIHNKNKHVEGDIGVISLDREGNFGISFNSEHMHRAWQSSHSSLKVGTYKHDLEEE